MRWLVASAVLLLLPGCQGAGYEAFYAVVSDLQRQGVVTPEQAQALIQALQQAAGGIDWGELALSVGSSIVFALTGVRLWRGGVTSRKGEPPTKAE